MYIFKKRPASPSIQLYHQNGSNARLNLTFKNGEIHINPDRMTKGEYLLTIDHGSQIESRSIIVN